MLRTTGAVFLGLVLLTNSVSAGPNFRPRRDFGSEQVRGPGPLVVADFNGDELPDIAIGSTDRDGITILINDGKGSFRFPGFIVLFPVPGGVGSMASGDFDRDGNTDLVVTTRTDGPVVLLPGDGSGQFRSRVSIPAGSRPHSVAVGDFNGDGISDLVVANNLPPGNATYPPGVVTVLLGNGDGTFGEPIASPTSGMQPGNLVVADFNRDDILDVAVLAVDHGRAEIDVLLGKGDGSFGPPQVFDEEIGQAIAVADFNQDGLLDLATPTGNGISVLLGRGDGTFDSPLTRQLSMPPNQIAAADFDRDGEVDLVVSNSIDLIDPEQPITITILAGNGDGTFGDEQIVPVGTRPSHLAVADLNRDEQPDLIVGNSGGYTVSVLINDSSSKR